MYTGGKGYLSEDLRNCVVVVVVVVSLSTTVEFPTLCLLHPSQVEMFPYKSFIVFVVIIGISWLAQETAAAAYRRYRPRLDDQTRQVRPSCNQRMLYVWVSYTQS